MKKQILISVLVMIGQSKAVPQAADDGARSPVNVRAITTQLEQQFSKGIPSPSASPSPLVQKSLALSPASTPVKQSPRATPVPSRAQSPQQALKQNVIAELKTKSIMKEFNPDDDLEAKKLIDGKRENPFFGRTYEEVPDKTTADFERENPFYGLSHEMKVVGNDGLPVTSGSRSTAYNISKPGLLDKGAALHGKVRDAVKKFSTTVANSALKIFRKKPAVTITRIDINEGHPAERPVPDKKEPVVYVSRNGELQIDAYNQLSNRIEQLSDIKLKQGYRDALDKRFTEITSQNPSVSKSNDLLNGLSKSLERDLAKAGINPEVKIEEQKIMQQKVAEPKAPLLTRIRDAASRAGIKIKNAFRSKQSLEEDRQYQNEDGNFAGSPKYNEMRNKLQNTFLADDKTLQNHFRTIVQQDHKGQASRAVIKDLEDRINVNLEYLDASGHLKQEKQKTINDLINAVLEKEKNLLNHAKKQTEFINKKFALITNIEKGFGEQKEALFELKNFEQKLRKELPKDWQPPVRYEGKIPVLASEDPEMISFMGKSEAIKPAPIRADQLVELVALETKIEAPKTDEPVVVVEPKKEVVIGGGGAFKKITKPIIDREIPDVSPEVADFFAHKSVPKEPSENVSSVIPPKVIDTNKDPLWEEKLDAASSRPGTPVTKEFIKNE